MGSSSGLGNNFLNMTLKGQVIKEKNQQNWLKTLSFKCHHQESDKTAKRMWDNICKLHIW